MSKTRDFDNILDECLERMIAGGETVEQCLAAYSEHAGELEPLLQTAAGARSAIDIEPSAEFRERAAYQFQAALRDMETEKPRGFFSWQQRWAMPLAAVVVVLVAGGGTVAAAGNSLPDEPLYSVKLATEAVRLAFTPTDIGKAELYVQLADERVAEIIEMAEDGKVDYVESTTQRLDGQLIAMSNNMGIPAADTGSQVVLEAAPRMMLAEESTAAFVAPEAAPAPAPALAEATDKANSAKTDTDVTDAPLTAAVAPPPSGHTGEPVDPEPIPLPSLAAGGAADVAVLPPKPLPAAASPTEPAAPPMEATADIPADVRVWVTAPEIVIPAPAAPPADSQGYGTAADDGELSAEAALKIIISQRAMENTEALQEILDRVPEAARPALLRALEVANAGYANVLRNSR